MESAVKKVLGTNVFKPTGLSGGGCISSGCSYITDNGTVFVKFNHKPNAKAMFDGEKAGLEAILATRTIKCPKPITVVTDNGGPSCALVMENLNMSSLNRREQSILGEQLARMHLHNKTLLEKDKEDACNSKLGDGDHSSDAEIGLTRPVKKFGFDVPTSCGYLSQDNTWQDDWTTFFVHQKLQAQVDLLLQKKGDRELNDIWPICKMKIEEALSSLTGIVPALVHGDLWSGNIASADNVPVIFDPATFYGHSEFDFGIANMFGGFSYEFYDSYHRIIPKTEGFSKRVNMYELFHHLNHWNHFGSGYRGSSIGLMKKISNL